MMRVTMLTMVVVVMMMMMMMMMKNQKICREGIAHHCC
jgi:preprotein translocase subunit YajC